MTTTTSSDPLAAAVESTEAPSAGETPRSFVSDEALLACCESDPSSRPTGDFAIFELNDHGEVTFFNGWAADETGISAEMVTGRDFFGEVAPCANNSLFRGTFQEGVERGQMNVLFPYTLTYRVRPTNVLVHLFRDAEAQRSFIFMIEG